MARSAVASWFQDERSWRVPKSSFSSLSHPTVSGGTVASLRLRRPADVGGRPAFAVRGRALGLLLLKRTAVDLVCGGQDRPVGVRAASLLRGGVQSGLGQGGAGAGVGPRQFHPI